MVVLLPYQVVITTFSFYHRAILAERFLFHRKGLSYEEKSEGNSQINFLANIEKNRFMI